MVLEDLLQTHRPLFVNCDGEEFALPVKPPEPGAVAFNIRIHVFVFPELWAGGTDHLRPFALSRSCRPPVTPWGAFVPCKKGSIRLSPGHEKTRQGINLSGRLVNFLRATKTPLSS